MQTAGDKIFHLVRPGRYGNGFIFAHIQGDKTETIAFVSMGIMGTAITHNEYNLATAEYVDNQIPEVEDGFSPLAAIEPIDGGHRVTITDKEGAKTFDVMDGKDGEDGSGGVTSWNDLTDKPFGDLEELLPETEFQYSEAAGIYGTPGTIGFMFGETYVVNWNGVEYTTVATVGMYANAPIIALGNPAAWSGENNNLPFVLACVQDTIGAIPLDGSTSVTVGIRAPKKLHEQYVSDPYYIYKTAMDKFDGNWLYSSELPLSLMEAVYQGKPIYIKMDGDIGGLQNAVHLAPATYAYVRPALEAALICADKTSETFKVTEGAAIDGIEFTTQQLLAQMVLCLKANISTAINHTEEFSIQFIDVSD